MPPGERFEWYWSILGSATASALLNSDDTHALLQRAARLRILTEPRQITYLDQLTLRRLDDLLRDIVVWPTDEQNSAISTIRHALANSPTSFSALVAALWSSPGCLRALRRPDAQIVHRAAEQWLFSPAFCESIVARPGEDVMGVLHDSARQTVPMLLPNVTVDAERVVSTFLRAARDRSPLVASIVGAQSPRDVYEGVLFHLFRPVSLTYDQMAATVAQARDCTAQVAENGLRPGGRHWSDIESAYCFVAGGDRFRIYVSKNPASILAKGSVGICTAGDLALFHRDDHHNLNILDVDTSAVVGNVQLHVITRNNHKILLIRAINTTTTYLSPGNARTLIRAVLRSCLDLAVRGNFEEAHLTEGLSFWHINSSRPLVRAVLDELYAVLPCVVLDPPLHLYRFGNVDVSISKAFRLWSRDPVGTDPYLADIFRRIT